MVFWTEVEKSLAEVVGPSLRFQSKRAVAGGSINQSFQVNSNHGSFFVKINDIEHHDMFVAEAEGLEELQQVDGLRVPTPLVWGGKGQHAFLVLEDLQLGGSGSHVALGQGVAALHRVTSDRFGWYRDNTIGSTKQKNTLENDWCDFWGRQRLGFQIHLALQRGAGSKLRDRGERLIEALPVLIEGHRPQASLLHGDLWSGNYGFTRAGEPTIFDPAVYYGDREADLAMTELFGGFNKDFYAAYQDELPLDDGYSTRKTLYNCYHILNHFNLFGGTYLAQAEGMVDSLLSEVA